MEEGWTSGLVVLVYGLPQPRLAQLSCLGLPEYTRLLRSLQEAYLGGNIVNSRDAT